ncbi:hypothetical protein [Colwellia sp. MEBiC06753]
MVIAYLALTSWKKQHKSQKITSLLDELTDSIHDFIQLVSVPSQHLQYIHISIESYQNDPELDKELDYPETVRFIQNKGQESASRMMDYLRPCASPVHKIKSLVVKAQMFNIENFQDCVNACEMITWQYDRLQVVYSIISSNNMNWKHPKVIEHLGHLSNITYEDIQKHLNDNQLLYLKFVKASYSKEYNS